MKPEISPRTRTWPNAPSTVRLSAPGKFADRQRGRIVARRGCRLTGRGASSSGRSMNILLLGSGGREDALAWRLRQSPSCDALVAAPGNPGIARWAECVAIDPCDPHAVVDAGARARAIDLVVDRPRSAAGRRRRRCAARAPGSRCSARTPPPRSSKGRRASPRICARRTASRPPAYVRVETEAEALAALDRFAMPVVIKADGLAAGKGVTVAMTRDEAEAAIGAAGDGRW